MASAVAPTEAALAPSIGELWCIQGSPWSVRVRWTVALCGVRVDERSYSPFVDQFWLWARLGFPVRGPKLTLPVLFPAARGTPPLRSSYDISKFVATQAGADHVNRLFPTDYGDDVRRFVKLADTVMEYGRGEMNVSLKANPRQAVKLFVPPKAQGMFFAVPVVRLMLWLFGRKYPSSLRTDVSAALIEIQSRLRANGTGYLCGDGLTFADICVSCAIFFGMEFGRQIPASEGLAREFPDLVEWRDRISEAYFIGDEKEAFDFKPPREKDS
jgi:glutathione S-transferase